MLYIIVSLVSTGFEWFSVIRIEIQAPRSGDWTFIARIIHNPSKDKLGYEVLSSEAESKRRQIETSPNSPLIILLYDF